MDREAAIDVLIAKDEIREAMERYARGVDRRDEELVRSAYHDDAPDEHGWGMPATGWEIADLVRLDREGFPDLKVMQHVLGQHHIAVDGDTARSETYFLAFHRFEREGVDWDMVWAGRYLDRWERRDGGTFRIADRTCVYDWIRTDEVRTPWPGPDHDVPKVAPGAPPLNHQTTVWGVAGPEDPSHALFPRLATSIPIVDSAWATPSWASTGRQEPHHGPPARGVAPATGGSRCR